jgi:hypothetical protein
MGIVKSILKNHYGLKLAEIGIKPIGLLIFMVQYLNLITYGNIPDEFYPLALETLQMISKMSDVVIFLYTLFTST